MNMSEGLTVVFDSAGDTGNAPVGDLRPNDAALVMLLAEVCGVVALKPPEEMLENVLESREPCVIGARRGTGDPRVMRPTSRRRNASLPSGIVVSSAGDEARRL